MLRPLLLTTALGLAAGTAWAQPQPAPNRPAPSEARPFFSRIRGLFDIDLPDLDPPGTVKLILHPHFSDLVRRDYMRVDGGFRWAVNEQFEISSEASAYFTHGFGGGSDGYGIGEVRLGTKYIFAEWLRPDFETSVAFNAEIPTGQPPLDLTDGHNHYSPSFVISHHVSNRPKLTTFASVALDFLTPSSSRGTFQTNQPRDDSVALTAGAIYDLGQIKWTLAGTYANTWPGGGSEHFFYLRPSVLWYVPTRLTFHSRTQWIIGLGARSTWGPDGYEFGQSTRVRAEITFRQVMASIRERQSRFLNGDRENIRAAR